MQSRNNVVKSMKKNMKIKKTVLTKLTTVFSLINERSVNNQHLTIKLIN